MMENAILSCPCKVLRLPEDLTIIACDENNTQYKISEKTAKALCNQCGQLEMLIIGNEEYPTR